MIGEYRELRGSIIQSRLGIGVGREKAARVVAIIEEDMQPGALDGAPLESRKGQPVVAVGGGLIDADKIGAGRHDALNRATRSSDR